MYTVNRDVLKREEDEGKQEMERQKRECRRKEKWARSLLLITSMEILQLLLVLCRREISYMVNSSINFMPHIKACLMHKVWLAFYLS
jgi:hypothetical protein